MLPSCLPLLPYCGYMVDGASLLLLKSREKKLKHRILVDPYPVDCLSITRCILIHLYGKLGGTRGHMAEWCSGRGETKVARNVPTPSPLFSPATPIHTLIPGFHSASAGGWWCTLGEEIPLSPLFCLFPMFRPNPPTLTWVPNCSLVGATTDLSPAFIQIYHN